MLKSLIVGLIALFAATFGIQHGAGGLAQAHQQHPAQVAATAVAITAAPSTTTPSFQPASSGAPFPASGSPVDPPVAAEDDAETSAAAPIATSRATNVFAIQSALTELADRVSGLDAAVSNLTPHTSFADSTALQGEIAALQNEVAQTNRIGNLSDVTLSSPSIVSPSISGLTTSQVGEGSNLYFTNARVASYINSSSTIPTALGTLGSVLSWTSAGWASVATSSLGISSGGGTWGSITGTLANQTDLESALNAKLASTSLSATTPLSYNSSTGVFSIQPASASQVGFLASSDWTTFNGKLGSSTIASLSAHYDPVWTGSAFANGAIYDTGSAIGIGTTSPSATLSVNGSASIAGNLTVTGNTTLGATTTWTTTGTNTFYGGITPLVLNDNNTGLNSRDPLIVFKCFGSNNSGCSTTASSPDAVYFGFDGDNVFVMGNESYPGTGGTPARFAFLTGTQPEIWDDVSILDNTGSRDGIPEFLINPEGYTHTGPAIEVEDNSGGGIFSIDNQTGDINTLGTLTVVGTSTFSGTLTAATTSTTNLVVSGLAGASGCLAPTSNGTITTTGCSGGGASGTVGSGTQGQFPFYNASGNVLTGTSDLFLATNGNIGVGSTSPATALSVFGSTYLTGGLGVGVMNTATGTLNLASGGSYQINGSSVLNATTLGSGVSSSSLTSLGTLSALSIVNGASINSNVTSISSNFNIGNNSSLLKLSYGGADAGNALSISDGGFNTGGLVVSKSTLTGASNTNIAGELITASFLHSDAGAAGSIGNGLKVSATNNTASAGTLYGINVSATANNSGATAVALRVSANSSNGTAYSGLFTGGDVGIGTTTPYSRLEVWGSDTASTTAFSVVNSASTTVFAVFDNGNSTYSGSIFQSSDERLKTEVQSLDASSSLALIDELSPVSYLRIDQPGTGENLGFIAQQVGNIFPELVSTTSATALTPDGTLTLNYTGLVAPIVGAIQEIATKLALLETTVTDFAQSFTTQILTATSGNFTSELCVGSTCVTPAQFQAMVAAVGEAGTPSGQGSANANASASPTSTPTGSSTPPTIEINGDNPAAINVGATYNDLGAIITGPTADLNLGIATFVNGVGMSPVQIDTSQPATDTIDYVVTDAAGLIATSTRTVIVEAATSTP